MGLDKKVEKVNKIVGNAIILSLLGNFSGLIFSLDIQTYLIVKSVVSFVVVFLIVSAGVILSRGDKVMSMAVGVIGGILLLLTINALLPFLRCSFCSIFTFPIESLVFVAFSFYVFLVIFHSYILKKENRM